MRIEEVIKTKLSNACDKELLILKLRFTQAWDRNIKNKSPLVVSDLTKSQFLKKYKLLLDVMNSRQIEKSTSDIDVAVFKKAMTLRKYGLDVSDLEDVIVVEDCIIINASNIDIEKISGIIEKQQREIAIASLSNGFDPTALVEESYIPLYDLVLKAKSNTVVLEIFKPYPNEHAARLKDPDKFDEKSFRRTKGGLLDGSKKIPSTISIIWGKLKTKAKPSDPSIVQSLRFSTDDWTQTKAKLWLVDNKIKFTSFETAKKKAKKLLTKTSQSKSETKKENVQIMFDKFVPVYPMDKADSEEHIVCGLVYEPDEVDSQGDKANENEIRKAAYQFMEQVQTFKVMHKGKKVKVKVLESYLAPTDFTVAGQKIKKGSWLITVRVLDKKIWKAVKDGTLTGFSMAGQANVGD